MLSLLDPLYERLMQLMNISAILPPQDKPQLASKHIFLQLSLLSILPHPLHVHQTFINETTDNLCFLIRRRFTKPIDPLDVAMILGKDHMGQFRIQFVCKRDTVIVGSPQGSREAALGGLRAEIEGRIGEMGAGK
jgi:hypothetical protein